MLAANASTAYRYSLLLVSGPGCSSPSRMRLTDGAASIGGEGTSCGEGAPQKEGPAKVQQDADFRERKVDEEVHGVGA